MESADADETLEGGDLLGSLNSAAAGRGHRMFAGALADRSGVQIDLNDEAHLGDLEDSGLMSHMEEARQQLASQETAAAGLPAAAELDAAELEGRRGLSSLTLLLREQRAALAQAREMTMLIAGHSEKLASGVVPHGFPRAGSRDQLMHLSSRISATGTDVERICAQLEAAESELTRVRRHLETAASGRTKRASHFEAAWSGLSKLFSSQ